MQFTKFGHTGLTVSRMILGTGTFGKQTDEKEAHRMLDKAARSMPVFRLVTNPHYRLVFCASRAWLSEPFRNGMYCS
jgi:hypothetical protein